MATISYRCDTCKRSIELVEQPQGFTVVGKCVITNGCIGRLYRTERNPNNVRESAPTYVAGLDNYVPRRAFYEFNQTLSSNNWKVTHNMGILPSTTVYLREEDGSHTKIDNNTYKVTPVDKNTIMVSFTNKVRGIIQCIAKSTVPIVPSTVAPESEQFQVSSSSVITIALPKYLTQMRGIIPQPSIPMVTPTVTPSPTPTQTPVNLPLNLCNDENIIQLEIEITKPNEEPFVCFEDVDNFMDSRSPWNGWGEVLVGKRRNYCIRTIDLLKMKVFGDANLRASDIPDGTRIRFLRIDYGTGRKEAIPSRGLLMLLAKKPYAYADKIKDRLVDVGELLGDTPDYFVYRGGELFLDETKVERSYPDISRVIYQVAPPQPSPTPTPTVTLTISVTPSLSATPSPSVTPTLSATPTISNTPVTTQSPTPTPTSSVTPTVTSSPLPPMQISGSMGDANVSDFKSGSYIVDNPIGTTSFSLHSGSLPPAVLLSSDGSYSGTVSAPGSYSWTIQGQDTAGRVGFRNDTMQVASITGYFRPSAVLGNAAQSANTLIRRGLWALVAAEFNTDTGDVNLYVNGQLVGTTTSSANTPGIDFVVGGTNYGDNSYQTWRGLLWGTGVANGGLTTDEHALLWNNGEGIRFADISASSDPAAVSLWNKLIYAWQLDTDTYLDSKGNKNLTQSGTVTIDTSDKFGPCVRINRAGRLIASGSNAQGLESTHSTYFSWIYTEVISSDNFPAVISRYDGGGDFKGIRCYWESNA